MSANCNKNLFPDTIIVSSRTLEALTPSIRDQTLARKYHSESGPVCRVYLCANRSANETGYCQDHVSPLRTGKAPYTEGSAPVVRKKAA